MRALESKQMLKMSSFGTNTRIDREEAPCTGTECSKSWSATRPFKETAEKIPRQWFRLYVVYERENIYSSHAQKSPEWSFVRADCVKKEIAAERLLLTRSTFSKSLMVSVGVSKLGQTQLIFVDPAVKINGAYYRDVLLTQQLPPVVQEISGDFFMGWPRFHTQRDSAHFDSARLDSAHLNSAQPALQSARSRV